MAIQNLGRVGIVLKGAWSGTTSYVPLDLVSYDGNSWVAKRNNTNVEPNTTNTSDWQLISNNSSLISTVQGYKNDAADSASAAAASATAAAASAADGESAKSAISLDYSTSATYHAGDYVWHSGTLYRAKVDIFTSESWTAAHWEEAVIGEDLAALSAAVTALPTDTVLYGTSQSLTDAQKTQARGNIGAAGESDVANLKSATNALESAALSLVENATDATSANYYYKHFASLNINKYYAFKFSVTHTAASNYKFQIGTAASNESMVDTLFDAPLHEGDTILIAGYKPSVSGLEYMRSSQNYSWSLSIYEYPSIAALIADFGTLSAIVTSQSGSISVLEGQMAGKASKTEIDGLEAKIGNVADTKTESVAIPSMTLGKAVGSVGDTISFDTGSTSYFYAVFDVAYMESYSATVRTINNYFANYMIFTDSSGKIMAIDSTAKTGEDYTFTGDVPAGASKLYVTTIGSESTAPERIAVSKTTLVSLQEQIDKAITNPMTASGDIIYGSESGTPTRLAKGANGQVLKLVSGFPAWSNESGGGGGGGTFSTEIDLESGNESATLGDELASGTGWTLGTGWTGSFAEGFTHSSGTDALEFAFDGIASGKMYVVSFASTVDATDTNILVTIGNSDAFPIYGMPNPYKIGMICKNTDPLKFIPSTTFTGKISNISIKEVVGVSDPYIFVVDTESGTPLEFRTGLQSIKNLFIGKSSGRYNVYGFGNVGIGFETLINNICGFWNTAVGLTSLRDNETGSRNVGIGYGALQTNISGHRNIAVGTFALISNTTGYKNISIGSDSMDKNTSGSQNVAIGFQALYDNTTGGMNVAIGEGAARKNTTGERNVAIGANALASATTSNYNMALGSGALTATTGTGNVAMGFNSLYRNTGGSYNVSIGHNAGVGSNQASQAQNVFVGSSAGKNIYNGVTQNTFIGYQAGQTLVSGANNICIGANADVPAATTNDYVNVGGLIKGSMATGNEYTEVKGDLFVTGTDGVKRQIVFNQDNTISWAPVT